MNCRYRGIARGATTLVLVMSGCTRRTPTVAPSVPVASAGSTTAEDFLVRRTPGAVRVMALNVSATSISSSSNAVRAHPGAAGRPERLRRVLRAIDADIICLQEMDRSFGATQVAAMLDSLLPIAGGQHWKTTQTHDAVLASRFPVVATTGYVADFGSGQPRGHAIAAIDLPDSLATRDPVVICTHFQSKAGSLNISSRQKHADYIVRWLREDLPRFGRKTPLTQTPLVLMGDLNSIDSDPLDYLRTLETGVRSTERKRMRDSTRIASLLVDLLPTHNGRGDSTYTWRDDTQPFNPGRLDHVLISPGIGVNRSFVLNTLTMSASALSAAGLQADDILFDTQRRVHDHLPVVADLLFAR